MINKSDKSTKQGEIIVLSQYRNKKIQDKKVWRAKRNKPLPFHMLSEEDRRQSMEAMMDED